MDKRREDKMSGKEDEYDYLFKGKMMRIKNVPFLF
jgi:hypothetical protein